MIIRLIPPPPITTVLFTVSFNLKLPPAIPLPQFYTNQLHLLSQHDLDQPTSYHSLDKATWPIACLHEVAFDLSLGNGLVVVRCLFVDGDVKEWTFQSDQCTRDLSNVFRDVEWSAMQAEREKYQRYGMQPPPEVEPLQPKKHKKQRSLLMTLVSSLVPSTSPARVRGPSPPPSPRRRPPPPPSNLSSHALRRRARSALVDSFRRYVISGLSQYFPSSTYGCGYVPFIVRSMLRRNEEHMASLLHEAGLTTVPAYDMAMRVSPSRPKLRGHLSESPFFDDDEGEETSLESRSTDTDGSSVHTPTDSPGYSPLLPTPPPSNPSTPQRTRPSRDLPRTPTPPSPSYTTAPQTLSNINALNNNAHRLQHLLASLAHSRVLADADDRQLLAVLEVKSRRRAWSNRALLGGAGVCDIGFGMPERSSPLGRSVVNADEVEVDLDAGVGFSMEEGWNGNELVRRMRELNLRRTPSKMSLNSVNRLFPVTEEDEEEHVVDLQTTSRMALDMFSDHDQEEQYGDESFVHDADEFDGMTPSVRLIEDAENGLLMPLPLPFSPTPPTSPTSRSFASSDGPTSLPPPRRERKRSMMNRPSLPVLEVETNVCQDPDLPVPAPVPSQHDLQTFHMQQSQYHHQQPQYHHGHPLRQTAARYRFDPQTKIEIFDVSYDDDLESSYSSDQYQHSYRSYPSIAETEEPEEFTLAMDVSPPLPLPSHPSHLHVSHMSLPLPVTAHGAGSGGKRFDHDEWIVDVGQGVEVEVDVGVRCR